MKSDAALDKDSRLATVHLGLLFALIYFVQGLAEPSEGLIAQPVRSLLNEWKKSPSQIAHFMAVVSIPWAIKPLYGLIIDFVPLFGSRRRNYLLLSTAAATVTLIWLGCSLPQQGAAWQLLPLLVVPTLAVAFSDVVVDALMVEKGQPLGITGRLQSIQWGSMYSATILAGSLGGWMSENHRQDLGFLICGGGAAVSLIATWFWIHDSSTYVVAANDPSHKTQGQVDPMQLAVGHESLWSRLTVMRQTLVNCQFLFAAAFLFLWNFNPFSSTIQQLHMTGQLKLTDQQYGHAYSLFSLGSIAACLIYGFLGRIVPARWLIQLAIAAGVLSTLTYLLAEGVKSAFVVSIFVGFVYMLGNLIQMDIAARMCPPAIAGSMFAMLMSVANVAVILSTSLGGWLYEFLGQRGGPGYAYTILVCVGSATTALCWGMTPWFSPAPLRAKPSE